MSRNFLIFDSSQMATVGISAAWSGCLTRVEVNGVLQSRAGVSGQFDSAANQWLRRGENVVNVRIDWPNNVQYAPKLASAAVWLEMRRSELPTSPIDRFRFVWPVPGAREAYPGIWSEKFVLEDFPETHLWSKSERLISIDLRDRSAIETLVSALHEAYQRRDVDKILELTRLKSEDLATSYGSKLDVDLIDKKQFLAELTASPAWQLEPLARDLLSLELMANGRIVLASIGMNPALRTVASAKRGWKMPVYCARFDGEWKIIR